MRNFFHLSIEYFKKIKPPKKPHSSPFQTRFLTSYHQWLIFFGICIGIFNLNLYRDYKDYQHYTKNNSLVLEATVQLQYKKSKNNHQYFVLKLEDERGHIFYTTSRLDLKPLEYKKLRIYGRLSQCSFIEFLKSCYLHTFSLSVLPNKSFKSPLRSWINSQHSDTNSAILYRALFFGDNINLVWREFSNTTGIAHIIAISGFHLGVLSVMVFFLSFIFYRPLQKRYFPYRNIFYDLGALVLISMFFYLLLLEFQPSFFRAFLMATLGFIFYYSGVKILSFESLILASSIAIALFPGFLWNIGFILSVFGVFYILLFVNHMPKLPLLGYFIVFDCVIFLLMGPIVHFYFPYFSPYQFVSIPISIIFGPFFLLVLGLHFLSFGNTFDFIYIWALSHKINYIEFFTPLWLFLLYISLSLLSIKFRLLFFTLIVLSGIFYAFLCIRYILISFC